MYIFTSFLKWLRVTYCNMQMTLCFFSCLTDIEHAVLDLRKNFITVMNRFRNNKISVNASKTKLVCFRSPWKKVQLFPPLFLHNSNCVSCCCNPVQYVSLVKYLGIYFDSDPSWTTRLSFVSKRLRSVSCQLYNVKVFLPFASRKMLMHSLA
uniref:Putative tick transposon n=1 Tax=Ixodes ricinus TaxID=34613 RepID=A0A147BN39_IXORI